MPLNAILNFYKPPGMTSAAAVGFIKALTGEKVGHAGTLDPEAAGVLPILIGKATKLNDYLMDSDKQYLAEIAFGVSTDTQDAQGAVVKTGENYPDLTAIREAAKAYSGEVMQLPPQYSALKIKGKTAYQLAREGKTAPLQPRLVRFDDVTVLRASDRQGFLLRVRCGKGAYIRTLCHDLGEDLGCPAHMRFLLREESAGLLIKDAVTREDLLLWKAGEVPFEKLFLKMDSLLRHLPFCEIKEEAVFRARNGVPLEAGDLVDVPAQDKTKVCLTINGELFGIYETDQSLYRLKVMLGESWGSQG